MLKKLLKRKSNTMKFMAWLLAGIMTLSIGGIMPVSATEAQTSWSFAGTFDTIEGTTGDYQGIIVDATNGKLRANGSSAQMNLGTILKVPVTGPCSVTVTPHGGQGQYALYTINGTQASTTESTTTVEYTGGAGYVEIVSTDNNAYIAAIELTYHASSGGDVSGGDVSGGDGNGGNEQVTTNRLTLDGAEVTYDLREQGFGAYSGNQTSWTHEDGILTVAGAITYNGGQHGANIGTGTVFTVNVPAGKTVITLGTCQYGSASAQLQVNGANEGAAVSIGGLSGDDLETVFEATLEEAGTVSIAISGGGYLHYIKAKTVTPPVEAKTLELDGAEVTYDLREQGFGAYGQASGWVHEDGILTVSGTISYNGGQHGANIGNGNVFTVNVPAGKTVITLGTCQYGSASAQLQVNGANEGAAVSIGGLSGDDLETVFEATLEEAGTVSIAISGGGYLHYIKAKAVTPEEEEPEQPGGTVTPSTSTYVLESSALTAAAQGTYTDGQAVAGGTDDFFTMYMSAKTKIDSSSKTWDDGYSSSQRLSFGSKAVLSTPANVVGFTTEGTATVKIWWAQGGDDSRQWAIWKDDMSTIAAQTSGTYTKNSPYYSELTLEEAGTYYLGGDTNNNYLFKVEVVDVVETPGEKLAEMTLEDLPEEWNVRSTSTIFGKTAADIEGDSVFSANKFIKITKDASDAWDTTTNGHGLTFTKPVVIEVLVPAETMGVFAFIGCDYASATAVMEAGDTVTDSVNMDQGQDAAIVFKYENETAKAVTMKITVTPNSRGYFHGVSYEVQELPAKSWVADKTGTVTIGDTTFVIKSGATEGSFTVTTQSGTGNVEVVGKVSDVPKALVWANLSGAKLSEAVAVGDGLAEFSLTGKTVTVVYEDDTTLPESFDLTVRELGKTTTPKQDGTTTTYDLTNGSVVSELHTNKIANGTNITSEDGNFTVQSAGGVYYHGTQYGIVVNANDKFAVNVAGDAKVTISGSSFGTSGITATADGDGVIYVADDETKTNNAADTSNQNPGSFSFIYEGDATTLYFTFTGATYYVTSALVKNELPPIPEGTVHPELGYTLPSIINWDNGKLEARIAGQTTTLMNPTGLVKENIKTSGLGIFVFPLTADNNTLTVDVVVGACGSSNNNAAYVGLFNVSAEGDNGIRAITTAIRNTNNEVVQLMSKKDNEVLGKNSFNGAAMEAGDVVRITISRDGSNIIQTFTNLTQGTATVEKTTAYNATKSFLNPDGEVYYGVMVSNRDTAFKNMVYTAADGTVLFDQNKYYDPVGDIPVVTDITAVGAEDRTKITISWTADDALFDAKYVLQVKKPGASDFEDVATELTDKVYEYPVSIDGSGDYTFRVCGTRGNAPAQNLANRNTYVVSDVVSIEAALAAPVVTLPLVSAVDKVVLSWTESAGAEYYEVYRSYDGNVAEKIATVTTTTYTDTAVSADVPYYYSVKAMSATNFSPLSEEKWTVTATQRSGDYDENVTLYVTKRSYNTVFENKISLEGVVGAAGTVKLYVNGTEKASQAVAGAGSTFAFADVEISAGRNAVELVLEYGNGLKTRKVLNYVYLTNYNFVVDDDFTGTDGTAGTNGVPQYKTVAAAIAAAGTAGGTNNVILVRNGDYNEKLVITTPNITLIGEDSEATRIHYAVCDGTKANEADGSRYAISIKQGATNFVAENICLENSWAYLGDGTYSNESAEAIYVEKTNALFVGVRARSYQDTIQNKDGNIYLLRSYVDGNVDFLWGVRGSAVFEDCDIVFRYNALKNSGYYTAYGEEFQGIFNQCRFYAEESCGGSKYYLGRPYNGNTAVAFINCYMGSILNKAWGYATWGGAELSSDPTQYNATEYVECGTYGAGFEININRRQISAAVAAQMLTTDSLGWDPYRIVTATGNKYVGSVSTEVNNGSVNSEYVSNKYSPYEGDDTGLGKYDMEGFAQSALVTGGGLLKETDDNYYKVATGDEFLAALKAVKDKKGVPSVIEITADIAVGINEINANHESLYGTGVVQAHNPALLNPVLIESGISKVYIKQMSNLTIFSQNGATVKHGAFNISDSDNIIIRNISFDELWEWDEGDPNDANVKAGDYDVNDWDYMTIDNGSNGVWIDHCTFYKAYDGIIDVKTSDAYATPMNVTISWCEFKPGSKNNTFFNEMMDYVKENKANMPYYQYLLSKGMSDEQIWWYAYGQKKTHLLGQSDDATANVNLKVTLANNYYYNCMDRMPRLRYGVSHVYNCIMDSQELLDVKKTVNPEISSKMTSNGAISTCNGQVLLENCYINGVQWVMISGNGASPNGSIAAVNSLYYVDGERYALVPLTKSTVGEPVKLTDPDAFVAALPYSDYNLYDAADLATEVKPYVGAGKLDLTVLQWEKGTYYDASFVAPEAGEDYDSDELPEYEIPVEVPATPGSGSASGSSSSENIAPEINWTEGTKDVEEAVKEAVSASGNSGVNVEFEASGEVEIPAAVLDTIAGKDVTVMVHNGDGVAMSITGGAVVGATAAINVTVDSDTNNIPASAVSTKTTNAMHTEQLSVKNDGAFEVSVNMHVNVGAEYAGECASLYRYNEVTGEMEFCNFFVVTEDGQAMFAMEEGGEYLLVVTDEAPNETVLYKGGKKTYIVKSGDSLYAIARMYKMSLSDLRMKNPQITDANVIHVGDAITVR